MMDVCKVVIMLLIAGGVWQSVCFAFFFSYAEKCLGNDLLSVIQSSGSIKGLRMHGSNRDPETGLLHRGVRCRGVPIKSGSTEHTKFYLHACYHEQDARGSYLLLYTNM